MKTRIKRLMTIGMAAVIAMLTATALTSCGCDNKKANTATSDEAGTVVSDVENGEENITEETTIPLATLNSTDQAIVDKGLTVDKDGKIKDKDGKEVKADKDGKIEVKTSNGETVKVDSNAVKTANENEKKVEQKNEKIKRENASRRTSGNSNAQSPRSVNNRQSSQVSNTQRQSSNNSTNKQQSSKSSNSNRQSSQSSTNRQHSSQSSEPRHQSSQNSDSHAGKTYHEAVYKTVNHPAETEQVWVVDKEAYTYEEPQYIYKRTQICWGCGCDVGDVMTSEERIEHMTMHHDKGEPTGYHSGTIQIPNGTKTVTVPEEGHYETKVIKKAWEERVLVREAGWY